jgi:hypothetical protein
VKSLLRLRNPGLDGKVEQTEMRTSNRTQDMDKRQCRDMGGTVRGGGEGESTRSFPRRVLGSRFENI